MNTRQGSVVKATLWSWMLALFAFALLQAAPGVAGAVGPTDILIDNDSVDEGVPAYTLVGVLSNDDPEQGRSFTYTIVNVSKTSQTDAFNISGNDLYTSWTFDYEWDAQTSYDVEIQVADDRTPQNTFSKVITIHINDVNEPTYNLWINGDWYAEVYETAVIGDEVGVFTVDDDDAGQSYTYSLVSTGVPFAIVGDRLLVDGPLDTNLQTYYQLEVYVDDGETPNLGGIFMIDVYVLPAPKTIVINVAEDIDDGYPDNGLFSLREALNLANPGDTIEFDPSLYPSAVDKSAANYITIDDTMYIPYDITINGPGADLLGIRPDFASVNYPFRIFSIYEGTTVNINNLTLEGGSDESPYGMAMGGAIALDNNYGEIETTLTVENCIFISNTVVGAEGGGAKILSALRRGSGTLPKIEQYYAGGFGGAIFFNGYGTLTVLGCGFESNSVETTSGFPGPYKQQGGSVSGGGAIFSAAEYTVIEDSYFYSNYDYGPGQDMGGGGAVFLAYGISEITNCQFDNNATESLAGGGGALLTTPATETTVTDSWMTYNYASGIGGGILALGDISLDRTSVCWNRSDFFCGGIAQPDTESILNMVNSTVSSNSAAMMGAVYVMGEAYISYSAIVRNTVDGDDSGYSSPGLDLPGGESLGSYGFARLDSNIIAENFFEGNGEGIVASDIYGRADFDFETVGGNIIGVNTAVDFSFPAGTPNANNDYVGEEPTPVDPLLAPLEYFGGFDWMPMHGLLLNSPARDFGTSGSEPAVDQRGAPRSYKKGLKGRAGETGPPDSGPYEVQDFDGDGILDDEENTVPSRGYRGISPVTDGNGDGFVDSNQPNVTSLQNAKQEKDYLTVEVLEPLTLDNVYATLDPFSGPFIDPDEFEYGFVNFEIHGLAAPGDAVDATIYYSRPLITTAPRYYKAGLTASKPTLHLYGFNLGSPSPTLGAEFIDYDMVVLHLRDGDFGDNDLTADQVIMDPGGVGGGTPLYVSLSSFDAAAADYGQPVTVRWETAAEIDNLGFNLYRATPVGGGKFELGTKLNTALLPGTASETSGAVYTFLDTMPLAADEQRAYWLEDISYTSFSTYHGPASATVEKAEAAVGDWQLY